MTTTMTIPADTLRSLGLHEGDTLHIIAEKDSAFVVEISRHEEGLTAAQSKAATEWLRTSTGIVKLAPGETEDDVRVAYYREKHKLDS